MNPILVVLILLGVWLFFPRRKQVPGGLKRTPKWKIVFRMVLIPFLVVGFWGAMFCIADVGLGFRFVLGGVGAVALGLLFCWAFTNICTFLYSPRYYRIWKAGGGDPFFSTLDPPFNTDPDAVRYQELYQEAARQQAGPPPTPPDLTRGINDSNII
jgi:hypothetical protein